jgi:UDP-N-acetylglucosamine 4,6-dehydratase
MNFKNKTILITGGTGSFGNAFVNYSIKNKLFKKIIIFSRDEMKQWFMKEKYKEHLSKLRFFIGDVRDYRRLEKALIDVDMVIHAAATKIVSTAEYDPFECVKTNVVGAMNVIDACINRNIPKVLLYLLIKLVIQ